MIILPPLKSESGKSQISRSEVGSRLPDRHSIIIWIITMISDRFPTLSTWIQHFFGECHFSVFPMGVVIIRGV